MSESAPPVTGDQELAHMSVLEHLDELRKRILRAIYGLAVVFLLCTIFSEQLFEIVLAPGKEALRQTGNPLAQMVAIDPSEQFSIIWLWTPLVAALFLGAPWVLWQVWAFVAPGLYRRERRWAAPFLLSTAGLFVAGGVFGYFVAFRYGMAFLFGIGRSAGVVPMISIDKYFERFVDILLGISISFELPILIVLLTLLRLLSPRWLFGHSRYAIMAILILTAAVTPTTDALNMLAFGGPMCVLYFLGIFAGYVVVLRREGRRFPRWRVLVGVGIALLMAAAALWFWKR